MPRAKIFPPATLAPRRRREYLAAEWREKAADLEWRAKVTRECGDPHYAECLEATARDYLNCADSLEYGAS